VLVTGVYGSGKSSVVADIGALLESRCERYGVLDVDWLGWFDTGAGPQVNQRVTGQGIPFPVMPHCGRLRSPARAADRRGHTLAAVRTLMRCAAKIART
jgi:hypothetical protein